jgi:hypothetical protein
VNQLTTIQPPTFSISEIERVALAIAKGGLFGSSDPNAVLTLCLLAQAEGQHPAVVFRDYHIIQGKPAKKAEAMLRDFITSGGKVEWHALTDELADATFSHPQGGTLRIDWTMKRAQQANISTPMWKKYPRQMLRSRVVSEGVRAVCPSATSGLYEENEVRDIVADSPVREVRQEAEAGPVIELRVEGGDEPDTGSHKGWREPDSPYSTPSKLHKAVASLERELMGCGDTDMVYGVTAMPEWIEFVRIAELHMPHYLRGGEPAPPEFEGLLNTAERMVAEFDTATANKICDVARV